MPVFFNWAGTEENHMPNNEIIRLPEVAGGFYPADKPALQAAVNKFLAGATSTVAAAPRVIFVPHAGYEYSGAVAAHGFKQLVNSGYRRVVIIGPSHHFPVAGLVLSSANIWQTPLGKVKVSALNQELAQQPDFKVDDAVHRPEHALEIEIPFLQTVLPEAEMVPIIVGRLTAKQQTAFAQVLEKYLDDQTALIVSVDLSHYHAAKEAAALDWESLDHILTLNETEILNDEIDAPWAVASVLRLARAKGWQTRLLKYGDSGDVTGDQSAVVGYGAVGFYETGSENREPFTAAEKKELLAVAKTALETYVKTGKTYQPQSSNPKFLKKQGAFVTLTKNGQLRGCIGYIEPIRPLLEAVRNNAIAAAAHDGRFLPVAPEELREIKIEISVLTVPQKDTVENIARFKKGAVLAQAGRGATYLPQVWDELSEPKVFFATLCAKGGLPGDCYLDPKVEVSSYEATVFHE